MSATNLLLDLSAQAAAVWPHNRPYRPGIAMRMLLGLAQFLRSGSCHIVLPDGQVRSFTGEQPGLDAICVVHNDRLARRALTRGALGFCEAYLDADWSSPDMAALFELLQQNESAFLKLIDGMELWRRLEGFFNRFRDNTRAGSRKNIAHHYDLGNPFYEQWLDRGMTYSSGIFDDKPGPNDPLSVAQDRKYQHMVERLKLEGSHHLLEIGCGWGGFAEYVARSVGCRVTGLTISRAQYDYARRRIEEAGLSDKVEIEFRDYRDIGVRQFDRIASIEMFEAVGEKHWQQFFATVNGLLRPNGIAAMQVITIAERYFDTYRRGADYIQKYIFPGGMLPTFAHLPKEVAGANMVWQGASRFGSHYARTLDEWRARFLGNWDQIRHQGFDDRFRRMWEQYFCYCSAGFRAGSIDVCQFSFSKPGESPRANTLAA